MRNRGARRARTAASCHALLVLLLLAPARAWGGPDREPLAGRRVHLVGIGAQTSSLAAPQRGAGYLDVAFIDETRLSSALVSGTYVRKGHSLRVQVDPARIAAYQASWERTFRDSLAADGLDPDTVSCDVGSVTARGRVRDGWVKFKTRFRVHCLAEGPFGRREAKGKVRFQGSGALAGGRHGSLAGVSWNLQMLINMLEDPGDAAGGSAAADLGGAPETP